MRFSDWSSDVCSSDLLPGLDADVENRAARRRRLLREGAGILSLREVRRRFACRSRFGGGVPLRRLVRGECLAQRRGANARIAAGIEQLGRASGRGSVGQDWSRTVEAASLKKTELHEKSH